jgi:hypothetical protein
VVVQARRDSNRLILTFFSVRTYTTREPIDIMSMPPAQRRRFDDYLEVIGLKARIIPCFDCALFDLARDRLELRMDHQAGMKSEGEDSAFTKILEHLNRILFRATTHMPAGLGLVSFLPAVERLYTDKSAGRVEHLGFVATTANASSNNYGKVHRREGQDLRTDPFHVGGSEAVSSIEPYTIGVSLASLSGHERLLLDLNGSVRMILRRSQGITHAGFHGCMSEEDFEMLSTVLEDHLPGHQ